MKWKSKERKYTEGLFVLVCIICGRTLKEHDDDKLKRCSKQFDEDDL